MIFLQERGGCKRGGRSRNLPPPFASPDSSLSSYFITSLGLTHLCDFWTLTARRPTQHRRLLIPSPAAAFHVHRTGGRSFRDVCLFVYLPSGIVAHG